MNEIILDIFPLIDLNCFSYTGMCMFIKNSPNVQQNYLGTDYDTYVKKFSFFISESHLANIRKHTYQYTPPQFNCLKWLTVLIALNSDL